MIVLYTILGAVVFAIVLTIIVALHEGGHFIVAKKSGILCHEYSICMGPLIAQKKIGETKYSLRAIPIGGYVAMAGEEADDDILKGVKKVKLVIENDLVAKIVVAFDNEKYKDLEELELVNHDLIGTKDKLPGELFIEVKKADSEETIRYEVKRDAMVVVSKKEELQIAPWDRTFANKPWINRFLSVLAGPFMNFVLTLVVFFLMGLIFGYADTSTTKVAQVSGAALEAGMENDDVIHSIEGVELTDWNSLSVVMDSLSNGSRVINADGSITVTYYKNGDKNSLMTATVLPSVYFPSSDLIVSYDKVNNKVQIANPVETFEGTKLDAAGLEIGDLIYKINDTEINGIDDIIKFYNSLDKSVKEVSVYVERNGFIDTETHKIKIYTLEDLDANGLPICKLTMGVATGSSFQFGKLMYMPWVQTGEASVQIIKTLKLLFSKNSSIGIKDLSGPLGILNLFVRLVQGEDAFYNIMYWMALLSVNIGIVNLLPLPALDGGRLAFMIYEGITRKKPTPKVENTIHNIGFILLMALFVFIFISDIIKCF